MSLSCIRTYEMPDEDQTGWNVIRVPKSIGHQGGLTAACRMSLFVQRLCPALVDTCHLWITLEFCHELIFKKVSTVPSKIYLKTNLGMANFQQHFFAWPIRLQTGTWWFGAKDLNRTRRSTSVGRSIRKTQKGSAWRSCQRLPDTVTPW